MSIMPRLGSPDLDGYFKLQGGIPQPSCTVSMSSVKCLRISEKMVSPPVTRSFEASPRRSAPKTGSGEGKADR
jgi:hypothetical protein